MRRLQSLASGSFVKGSTIARRSMGGSTGSPSERAVNLAGIDISSISAGPGISIREWVRNVVGVASRLASQYVSHPVRVVLDAKRMSAEECSIASSHVVIAFDRGDIFSALDFVCGRILIDSGKIAFTTLEDRRNISDILSGVSHSDLQEFAQATMAAELGNVYTRNRILREFAGWSEFFASIAGDFDSQVSRLIADPSADPRVRAVWAVIAGAGGTDCPVPDDICDVVENSFSFLRLSTTRLFDLSGEIVKYIWSQFPENTPDFDSDPEDSSEGEGEGEEGEGEEGEGEEGEGEDKDASAAYSGPGSISGATFDAENNTELLGEIQPGGGIEDSGTGETYRRKVSVVYAKNIVPDYATEVAKSKEISDAYLRYFSDLRWSVTRPPTPEFGHRGGDIDEGNLYRLPSLRDGRVFSRRPDSGYAKNAIGILLDCSGSMSTDGRMITARGICHALASVFDNDPKVSTLLLGHTTRSVYGQATPTVLMYEPTLSQILDLRAEDCNADGFAIEEIANRVRKMRGFRKSVIVIADGLPSAGSYHGDPARKHTSKAVSQAVAAGVDVFGIMVGHAVETRFADNMFGKGNWIRANDAASSGPAIGRVLRRILMSGGAS